MNRSLEVQGLDREIYRLAIPAALQLLLHTFQFIVDTKMISASLPGENGPLAALALVSPICWSLTTIFTVTSIGATAVVARRIGEGDSKRAESATRTSISLSLILGSLVTLIGVIAFQPFLRWLAAWVGDGASAEVISDAGGYLWWFLIFFPLRAVAVTLEAALRGAGESSWPFWGGVLANVANVLGNAVLIFGLFGLPRMGVEGVGLATGLAPLVEVILLGTVLGLGWCKRLSLGARGTSNYDVSQAKPMISVSLPALAGAVIFHTGFFAYQLAIYQLDEMAMAAHRIAIALQSAAFLPAHGFAVAAASIAGRLLGAGDRDLAMRSATRTFWLGLRFVAVISVAFLFASEQLVRIFDAPPETLALAAACIRIGAFEVPFLLATESFTGTLRGSGSTVAPMVITAVGTWGLRVPLAWILAHDFVLGVTGVWYATVADWILRGALCWWVVSRGKWVEKKL